MPGVTDEVRHGVIHRLEVENFKSYKGHQVIGPFKNFTAVVGPNGAGKSNLMDAISFVLGVRSAHLRGSQLKDLVYAADDSDRDRPGRRASVSLVYLARSPDLESTQGREIVFTRAITPAGASEYHVNGSSVSWDDYCSRLKQLGILVKARNFLVFQGDVESIASKSPKDLTALFEQISGSDELKKEYEQKEKAKMAAEERLLLATQKRKNTVLEKKQKKEQKEEAEKHIQKQRELREERAKYYLFQLLGLERDIDAAKESLQADNAEVQRTAEEQLALEAAVKQKARARKEHNAAVVKAERDVARRAAEIEKKRPEMVRLKEEIQRAQKRLDADVARLEELRAAREEQSSTVGQLERQIEDVSAQLEEVRGRGGKEKRELELGQAQMAEYNKRKEEAGARTSRLRQEKEALARQQQAEEEAKRNLEASVGQMRGREEQLQVQLTQAQQHGEEMRKEIGERRAALEQLRKKEVELRDQHRRSRHRAESLSARLASKEQELRELKADWRESERESRAVETVTSMRRLFPGVHGRLTDLCQLTQRKYSLAVTVAFGKLFDAVAVDNEATAKSCIEYLREQRLPPMTFIPLASARVKPVDQRLRALGGTSKLVLDVIQFEEAVQVAMVYALGGTLVCDSMDEARALAWGHERHKVVTLDGTLLAKNGCMTGGTSGGMEARSQQWDRREIEKLKSERDQLGKELAEAEAVRDAQSREAQMAAGIATAEKRLEFAEAEERMTTAKAEKLREELVTIEKERSRKEPEIEAVRVSLESRASDLLTKEQRVNEISDHIFRSFSAAVGVASIREYEETQLRQAREVAERQLEVSNQLARLRTQLQYERSRDTSGPVSALEQRIGEKRAALQLLVDQASGLQRSVEGLKEKLEALKEPLKAAKDRVESVESELQQLSKEATALTARMGKAKRNVTAKETTLVQLRSRHSELLEACSIEQVEVKARDGQALALPLALPPGMASQSTAGEAGGASGTGTQQSAEPMAEGATGTGTGTGTGGGSSSGVGGRVGREEDVPLDYSLLDRRLQQPMSKQRREEVGAELLAGIESLRAALESSGAPNMKAVEQYSAVREREREVVEEFEEARRAEREATQAFMEVQQQRCDRFLSCFSHVSSSIDPIYKALTSSSSHRLGGTAYLVLESEAEPFTAGVKYSAMPPSKRFRDMEQLSGGEKTVAALALLFAIHSFRPSPFFVLDEVDAALDNLNVAKVAAFIRSRSQMVSDGAGAGAGDGSVAAAAPEGDGDSDSRLPGFQSIVISLKDQFFSMADALIGVVRDHEASSSKTLSFDLSRFPTS